MYEINTSKNIHPDITSAEGAISALLNSAGIDYKQTNHLHRTTCRTTYRDIHTNRLLATVDILKWDVQELPGTPEFNTLRNGSTRFVNVFYTCIWN